MTPTSPWNPLERDDRLLQSAASEHRCVNGEVRTIHFVVILPAFLIGLTAKHWPRGRTHHVAGGRGRARGKGEGGVDC